MAGKMNSGAGARPHRVPGNAGPRLLLIEDHDDLADATAKFLRSQGFQVQIANTGKAAIQTAAVFLPEIVLCDLSLPDMSGFDVARQLRTQAGTEHVLFVIHSAMTKSDIGMSDRELRARNIDLFLTKPLTLENIEALRGGRPGSDK
jgi:DNA-binding response OmpR family regulator